MQTNHSMKLFVYVCMYVCMYVIKSLRQFFLLLSSASAWTPRHPAPQILMIQRVALSVFHDLSFFGQITADFALRTVSHF